MSNELVSTRSKIKASQSAVIDALVILEQERRMKEVSDHTLKLKLLRMELIQCGFGLLQEQADRISCLPNAEEDSVKISTWAEDTENGKVGKVSFDLTISANTDKFSDLVLEIVKLDENRYNWDYCNKKLIRKQIIQGLKSQSKTSAEKLVQDKEVRKNLLSILHSLENEAIEVQGEV